MPPKKKQQQIDIASLPPVNTINTILLVKGVNHRSHHILSQIKSQIKYISTIKKSDVIEHAKEKSIYVDASTLTDKQKKDPKFMETVSTELTPQVIAKAFSSLLNQLNIKLRLDKKAILDKPHPDIQLDKPFDWIYSLEDFSLEKEQLAALAHVGHNIRYVFVIEPKITWANGAEGGDEEDEEVIEWRKMQDKQKYTEADTKRNQEIDEILRKIKANRSMVLPSSDLRNTLITNIHCEIDPYNEQESVADCLKKLLESVSKSVGDYDEFMNWRKDKVAQKISQVSNVHQHPTFKGQNIQQYLTNICQALDPQIPNSHTDIQQQNIVKQINQLKLESFLVNEEIGFDGKIITKQQFVSENQLIFGYEPIGKEMRQLLRRLKYPGINRYMMPETPTKSEEVRKMIRSSYGQFIPKDISFEQFERRLSIAKLEKFTKEIDEQKNYKIYQRMYEEVHDQNSLTRELYKAMLFGEGALNTKYDLETDSLFLALTYKNPIRRASKKVWQSSWKVLPNLQNWVEYFKDNEGNLNNNFYYDIDYQRIGNISETTKVITTKDNGIILHKNVANANHLYLLKNNAIVGIKKHQIYLQDYGFKLYHISTNDKLSTILVFQDGNKIILKPNGDIISYIHNQKCRMNTPQGYTIIYDAKQTLILHPNGGVSYPPNGYINQKGKGSMNGSMHSTSTLNRKSEDGSMITKREDGTVIVEKDNLKWIKFSDQTEYLNKSSQIVIEKKGFPLVTCSNKDMNVLFNGISIMGKPLPDGTYQYQLKLIDQLQFKIIGTQLILDQYTFDLSTQSVAAKNQGDNITVDLSGEARLMRVGKQVDAFEDEQNYTPEDIPQNDFIHPRLFIIHNDNTAIEVLHPQQLQKYFRQMEDQPQIRKIKTQISGRQVLHYTRPISTNNNLKYIQPHFNINLDIFNYQQPIKSNPPLIYWTIRSFIKNNQLTQQDQKTIQGIISQYESWIKQNQKEQNEYGYANHEIIQSKYNIKKKIINLRKTKEITLQHQKIFNKALNDWNILEKKHRTIIQMKEEELKLRRNMSMKNNYHSNYKWIPPKEKPIQENLSDYSNLQFFPNYFYTAQGKIALSEMPILRPKSVRQKKQIDPEIVNELNQTMNKTNQKLSEKQQEQKERYDTVELNLSPNKQIIIKPSVFTRKEIEEERQAFQREKKSYQYHQKKRKDFNVYGDERKNKVEVTSLLRTQPISEINQKYLVTEAPVDKKIKISSMKNKLTMGASNMVEMRKQGPHSALIKTIDKKNDYDKLLERRTMMVHADLNDKLQRDVLINPIQANFGVVKQNKIYELKISIKNQDILAQRIILKKPKTICARVQMNQMGSIALGMTRKISVFLQTSPQINGKFTDQFDIVTKHEVYHIPIIAVVLSEQQFDKEGRKIDNMIKENQIKSIMRRTDELPPL